MVRGVNRVRDRDGLDVGLGIGMGLGLVVGVLFFLRNTPLPPKQWEIT